MILKRLFDILASFFGLLLIWWVFPIVAILIKVKMPGGPSFFCQKRVGKDGKLFTCHKFRSMLVAPARNDNDNENDNKNGWSSISVAGDNRITPLGATLRHYKIDELPELWDVLIGNMSFVGPRPDVPGYADKLGGDDRDVLKLRPGITGPATLKYRVEDEMIADFIKDFRTTDYQQLSTKYPAIKLSTTEHTDLTEKTDQEIATWYNDNIIYPDKVRLNCYYYRHYSFIKDIEMIFATVLGWKVKYMGEEI